VTISRRNAVLGLAAGLAYTASGCGSRSEERLGSLARLRQVANSGKLIVGLIPYYEILSDEGPGRRPSGFLADLFTLFARAADFSTSRIQWRTISWASFGAMIQSGGVDFSIAGTFVTPARAQAVAFTRPLLFLGNGAAARRTDTRFADIKSVDELDRESVTIAVVSGEQSAEYVRQKFTRAKILVLSGPDLAAAPRAVQNGSADVAMSDQFILSRYLSDLRHDDMVDLLKGRPFSVLPIAWAVAKNDDNRGLLGEIDPLLTSIVNSEEYRVLQARYTQIPFASSA
jgi:ABC-type amino acid transport substrate-binding protein